MTEEGVTDTSRLPILEDAQPEHVSMERCPVSMKDKQHGKIGGMCSPRGLGTHHVPAGPMYTNL